MAVLIINLIWYISFVRNPKGMGPQRLYRLFLLRNFVFFAISLPDLINEYNYLRNRRHFSRIRVLLAMLPMWFYAVLVPTGNLFEISYVLRDRSYLEEIKWLAIWND